MKNEFLPEKYVKAISLIEVGKLSYRDIAATCDIREKTFYTLIEGTYEEANIQTLFTAELEAAYKRIDKETRHLVKKNKKNIQIIMDRYLSLGVQRKNVDPSLISTVTSIANAISKSTPNVEIGSFTYQKGLSPEDIYAEFKRLTGLASDRGAVSRLAVGGTGEIPVAPGPGTPAS